MSTVKQFEDLICWQKARLLVKEVYRSMRLCKDYGFKDQIQRATVSVMSNIAEGFERGTRQKFLNYLYVALDIGYINIEAFKYLNGFATECSRLIQSFADKVKGGASRGIQYKTFDKTDDYLKELTKSHPELYKRFYGKD